MKPDLIDKLIQDTGTRGIAKFLSEMPGTDLTTLLMGVLSQRTRALTPSALEAQHWKNRLVIPCPVDQRLLVQADATAYKTLDPKFKGIELSPVAPLGVNVVLGGVNQKNVLGTMRNCEVLADPTTALTLACARRRKTLLANDPRNKESISFSTSARCMRLQRFDDIPGFVPHFKIFALATAGRDIGSEQFEIESMRDHVQFYLRYLSELQSDGYDLRDIHVALSDVRVMRAVVTHHKLDSAEIGRYVQVHGSSVFTRHKIDCPCHVQKVDDIPTAFVEKYGANNTITLLSKLVGQVLMPLQEKNPRVTFLIDLDRAAGMHYYTNACIKISASTKNGDSYPLVDGGFADWTQKILQSRKERLFTSGIGTELILSNFT